MKKIDLKAQLFIVIVFGSLAMIVGACALYAIIFPVYWTERLPISNASGQALTITEYRYASNVSYAELAAFLANDTTYLADYDYPNYTCGDFAVRLHNDAEAQGIRCGVVGVAFNASDNNASDLSLIHDNGSIQGHGFDVFNTTDRGIVYVDTTGITKQAKQEGYQPHIMAVYAEPGMPLGEIAFGQAGNMDYGYYRAQEDQYRVYEKNVSEFLNDAKAFDGKADSLNGTYNVYKADRAAFDAEYYEFSANLSTLKNSSSVDLESSVRLEAQRVALVDKLNALDARLDALVTMSDALNAEKAALAERRAALEEDADGSLIIVRWGIVDRIVVCW